jgi:hypothetical protein
MNQYLTMKKRDQSFYSSSSAKGSKELIPFLHDRSATKNKMAFRMTQNNLLGRDSTLWESSNNDDSPPRS